MTPERQAILLERAISAFQHEDHKTREEVLAWLENDTQDWAPPAPPIQGPPTEAQSRLIPRPCAEDVGINLTTAAIHRLTPETFVRFSDEQAAARHRLLFADPYLPI